MPEGNKKNCLFLLKECINYQLENLISCHHLGSGG